MLNQSIALATRNLRGLAIALVLSLLALTFTATPVKAAGNPAAITINNSVCDLNTAGYLGSGSSADPWQVSDPASLWEVSDCEAQSPGGYYVLTADINLPTTNSPIYSRPIGYVQAGNVIPFQGNLDGDGHAISNLDVESNSSLDPVLSVASAGLFGLLHDATISNLRLSGSSSGDTTATGAGEEYSTGGLAARSTGDLSVSNLVLNLSVRGASRVGGLVGVAQNAYVANVTMAGEVYGVATAGGFFGYVSSSAQIQHSTNSALVESLTSASSVETGGFVGAGEEFEFRESVNLGDVSGVYNVGGFVGYAISVTVSNSANHGAVFGGSIISRFTGTNVGGIVGEASVANIQKSSNLGSVGVWGDLASGLVALAFAANVSGSQNLGEIYARDMAPAGLVSRVQNIAIANSANYGSISGNRQIGGLISRVSGAGSLQNSLNVGTLTQTPTWIFQSVDPSAPHNGYTASPALTTIEGLVSAGNFTAVSTYTAPPASRSASIALDQFRVKDIFSGWDFGSVWGYRCADAAPVPKLRQLNPGLALTSETCPLVLVLPPEPQAPTLSPSPNQEPPGSNSSTSSTSSTSSGSSSGAGSNNSSNPNSPQVIGTYSASPASTLTISGRSLAMVTEVWMGTYSAKISVSEAVQLVVLVPNYIPLGTYDLHLKAASGTYRFTNALKIVAAPTPLSSLLGKSKLLPKFTKGKSKLDNRQRDFMTQLIGSSTVSKVVCTAITGTSMGRAERILIRARAKAACSQAVRLLPDANVWVQSRDTKNKFIRGRVLLTFKR